VVDQNPNLSEADQVRLPVDQFVFGDVYTGRDGNRRVRVRFPPTVVKRNFPPISSVILSPVLKAPAA
jgi:hypothetical protein